MSTHTGMPTVRVLDPLERISNPDIREPLFSELRHIPDKANLEQIIRRKSEIGNVGVSVYYNPENDTSYCVYECPFATNGNHSIYIQGENTVNGYKGEELPTFVYKVGGHTLFIPVELQKNKEGFVRHKRIFNHNGDNTMMITIFEIPGVNPELLATGIRSHFDHEDPAVKERGSIIPPNLFDIIGPIISEKAIAKLGPDIDTLLGVIRMQKERLQDPTQLEGREDAHRKISEYFQNQIRIIAQQILEVLSEITDVYLPDLADNPRLKAQLISQILENIGRNYTNLTLDLIRNAIEILKPDQVTYLNVSGPPGGGKNNTGAAIIDVIPDTVEIRTGTGGLFSRPEPGTKYGEGQPVADLVGTTVRSGGLVEDPFVNFWYGLRLATDLLATKTQKLLVLSDLHPRSQQQRLFRDSLVHATTRISEDVNVGPSTLTDARSLSLEIRLIPEELLKTYNPVRYNEAAIVLTDLIKKGLNLKGNTTRSVRQIIATIKRQKEFINNTLSVEMSALLGELDIALSRIKSRSSKEKISGLDPRGDENKVLERYFEYWLKTMPGIDRDANRISGYRKTPDEVATDVVKLLPIYKGLSQKDKAKMTRAAQNAALKEAGMTRKRARKLKQRRDK